MSGCVLCGEARDPGSPYCATHRRDECPHCHVVHDTRGGQCSPPTDTPTPQGG